MREMLSGGGVILRFDVPGIPVPWKRAGRANGHSYTVKAQRDYQERIRLACMAQIAAMRLRGEVWPTDSIYAMTVTVVPPNRKHGDASNHAKAVEDAVQATRKGAPAVAWKDDKQVAVCTGVVTDPHPRPGITVHIETLRARPQTLVPPHWPELPKPERKKRDKKPKLRVTLDERKCRVARATKTRKA